MKIIAPTKNTNIFDTHIKRSLNGKVMVLHNTMPLATFFNEHISSIINDRCIPPTEIIVFCHDDIKFIDPGGIEKVLQEGLTKYSIVGVAGARYIKVKDINLWHIMCHPKPFYSASGRVFHNIDNPTPSQYGEYGRVSVLDGVLMAFTKQTFLNGLRYDEDNPSKWHFYDLDVCLSANKMCMKMGTVPLDIVHASPGLRSIQDPLWNLGNEWFIRKWGIL